MARSEIGEDQPFTESDEAVGNVVIFFVMTNHEQGLSGVSQLREDFMIKGSFELGILVGGPLVEDADWPVFRKSLVCG